MAEFKIPIEVSEASLRRIAETVVAEMRKDPNADWVEVVRCKECKWFAEFTYDGVPTGHGSCTNPKNGLGRCPQADWFCADGERRTDWECKGQKTDHRSTKAHDPIPTPTTHEYVRLKRNSVRVRNGNGTNFAAVDIAHPGEEIPCFGQDDHYPYWYIVRHNGKDGYITSSSRYTEMIKKA